MARVGLELKALGAQGWEHAVQARWFCQRDAEHFVIVLFVITIVMLFTLLLLAVQMR